MFFSTRRASASCPAGSSPATKAFVNAFGESLRGEVNRLGINVTVLAPGPVRIDLPVEKLVPDFLSCLPSARRRWH